MNLYFQPPPNLHSITITITITLQAPSGHLRFYTGLKTCHLCGHKGCLRRGLNEILRGEGEAGGPTGKNGTGEEFSG